MMKLEAQLLDQNHDLNIEIRERRLVATIDGRGYDLEIRELATDEYLLVDGSELYDCYVGKHTEQPRVFEVHLRGASYEVKIIDAKRLRSGQTVRSHNHGVAQILAPMPGKVVRVLVELGAEVEAGAGVVVVEAMKMQNEMKAPKAGTVVVLSASAGATVNAGDVLAMIE
jgi:biotin carboxyl carrier protein